MDTRADPSSKDKHRANLNRIYANAISSFTLTLLFVTFRGVGGPKVSNEELRAISETLLKNDVNNAAKLIRVNYQSRTRSGSAQDNAPNPLITIGDKTLKIPTIAIIQKLYDNYVPDTMVNEQITPEETGEENRLLDAFLATPVMTHTMHFLAKHGYVREDSKAFRELLRTIWFTMYSRGNRRVGSSAFEHVFLGELKRGEVSGLHNWIYFGIEESKKKADYLGYIRKLELGGKGAVVKLHYKWSNVVKPVGTMFVGTSPELEMALYTICFLTRPDDVCPISLAGKVVTIRTHTFRYRGKNLIGSAFPQA